ncbi:non-ribosomal peptide synthetase [Microcoleus sp. ZQ-A2]|nr:amino acid adenylation domain-containing protein [Microcoleus sp. FACHB-1]
MSRFAKGAFNLSPKKQALLQALLQAEGVESRTPQKISRRKDDASIPLSFAQTRLWFLDQLQPDTAIHTIPGAFRLKGLLNIAALQSSFNEIIRRHEALRTTFTTVEGQPVVAIAPAPTDEDALSPYTLSVTDLRYLPDTEREVVAQKQAIEEIQQPFDLERGPLLRTTLLRLGEEEFILVLTIHHIVADGWALSLLIRELAVVYETFSTQKPMLQPAKLSPLPELPIQYADFADWQRKWLQGEVLETQLSYWKQQLGGDLPVLQLPSDRPRPIRQTFQGKSKSFVLSQRLSRAIASLASSEGATLYMTLLAAFKVLLYRYTGQEDILVGSPIANRNRTETEGLIGVFVNTLVMRTQLDGNLSFRELLGRVREVVLGADAHQDLPFEKLVEELQPDRNTSHSPLFQVMFVLQNAPVESLVFSGLTLEPIVLDKGTAEYDLTLNISETREGIHCRVEYNTDLFDDTTIFRMMGHFQTLLEGIVMDCEQRISQLPLLTQMERDQLLVEWNDTQADYPKDACIHQLFEAQVKRTPDAVAVVFEQQQLTYGQLNQRSNQLARHLKQLGVEPDVLVGICVERSLEMVVGLLGILKAGGAYVPLDPTYPQERLAFMLSDSQVSVLLTQRKLLPRLPKHEAHVICLDTDWEVTLAESEENFVSNAKPFNLAYVIYTSGSTGKPKGTIIPHQGVVNYLSWCTKAYSVADGCGAPVNSSIGFDATITSLFSPLLVGQKVVLLPEEQEIEALSAVLCSQSNFSLVKITPAHLEMLSQLLPSYEGTGRTRALIIGGEALLAKSLTFWRTNAPDTKLINEYGPTETVVGCCVYEVSTQTSLSGVVSIGRPIANTQIYLLDRHLQPVPIGVPGELHIGGDGLARGYLNRPELTHERFIPNPFSDKPGARLYKSGDLARYLPNGEIEYLGRIDHQVKVRGFRIELGEIEAVLSQHPAVRETVVVVREDEPGSKRLVAYAVLHPEQTLTITELRRFLEEKLPNYMVPTALVMLEELPLTPNGKVDRRTLPAPDTARPESESTFVPPRTPVEEVLAGIWSDVLRREPIGVDDNFFELGGDSILSLQIIFRANQAGFKLTPKQLFGHQTIAELATVASTNQLTQTEQGVVNGALPLTPIQHWFFEQELLEPHHWNQAVLLEVRQPLNPAVLEKVVQHLLVHHDALRLRFERQASGWQQVNADSDEAIPFTMVDLSALSDTKHRAAIEAAAAELQTSLNLSKGPLVRVCLFDLGADKPGRLLIVIHHLAVDGVSWRIMLEDLETVYEQLSVGEVVHLPSKTTSFKHWAERLTEYAMSRTLQQELDYWLSESWTRISTLPIDYLEGDNTEASASTVLVSLSPEETQALLQEVPSVYNTQINDVLLTALVQIFARWTGVKSLLLDLEGHGREEIFDDVDLSRTVGWFTTVFPILLDLRETSHPGQALKSVKEQLRRIPNRGIGYGLLRYLSDDKEITAKLREIPQAEVIFNYLGQLDQVWSGSSLFLPAKESIGPAHSLKGSRRYLLEVNGFVVRSQLKLLWTYSKNVYKRATVKRLAQDFLQALRSLIAHCQSPEAGGYTPSDFQKAKVSQKDLDQLLAQIKRGSEKTSQ